MNISLENLYVDILGLRRLIESGDHFLTTQSNPTPDKNFFFMAATMIFKYPVN